MSNGSSLEHEVVFKSLILTEGLVLVPTDARLFVYLMFPTKVRKSSCRASSQATKTYDLRGSTGRLDGRDDVLFPGCAYLYAFFNYASASLEEFVRYLLSTVERNLMISLRKPQFSPSQ